MRICRGTWGLYRAIWVYTGKEYNENSYKWKRHKKHEIKNGVWHYRPLGLGLFCQQLVGNEGMENEMETIVFSCVV